MPTYVDSTALDQWYALARIPDVKKKLQTRLLGQDILVEPLGEDAFKVVDARSRRKLPVEIRHGHLWTSLGTPARDVLSIPELDESDRRFIAVGPVKVRTSGLRVVENFLDLAHFPFVHKDILGVESHPAVTQYSTEIREDVDEVWATKCEFYQPKTWNSSESDRMAKYEYRVASPFVVLLYKTGRVTNRQNIIGLFIQPSEQDECIVHSFVAMLNDASSDTELLHGQQWIFLQDRIILENQRPRLLPMSPRAEVPTRADASSIAYRRWLKAKGLRFGTLEAHAA